MLILEHKAHDAFRKRKTMAEAEKENDLAELPILGKVLLSQGGKSIVKNGSNYYILNKFSYEGEEIFFKPEEALAKFPSLMYLFASVIEDNNFSEEELKMFLNIIKKNW